MLSITEPLFITSISTVFSKKNLDQYLWAKKLTRDTITKFDIDYHVTEIGECAFRGCTSLTSIDIPGSVTVIRRGAFENCTSLTSITFPNSVTVIGRDAFMYCSSLTSIIIPQSVTKIGEGAFQRCTSLAVIICNNPSQFDWDNIGINTTQIRIISYQEHLTNDHADLLAAMNLTGLNNDEAYLIYRMISEPEFNPSWEVLETTFNEGSFEQIRKLLKWLNKTIDHLPEIEIGITTSSDPKYNITHPLSPFLTIADRNSLFGNKQKNLISVIISSKQEGAAQQQTDEAPAAHHQFSRGV